MIGKFEGHLGAKKCQEEGPLTGSEFAIDQFWIPLNFLSICANICISSGGKAQWLFQILSPWGM